VKSFLSKLVFGSLFSERLFMTEARLAERWAFAAHKRLFRAQWEYPPTPEYFCHKIDLFYQWSATQNSYWLERGVFSMLALRNGADILELCCGDGFNAHFFYSKRANKLIAVDFEKSAIEYAKSNFKHPNVTYALADIRTQMPQGDFDNVIWDAAIEHFTEAEIESLMWQLKHRLKAKTGILSGYTIVERAGGKHIHQHEYEFKSKEDLARFLRPHFRNVTVFETVYPDRHNLYFWASDKALPFQLGDV
jgi:SAM-dependent methyltransferase